jgi:hypothetical protein
MFKGFDQIRRALPRAGFLLAAAAAIAVAQQGPVATMYGSDQKRDQSLASSFASLELPPSKAAQFPALVYLSAGDLERAFDTPEFRPDAAIVPTNTDLQMTAQTPATQRVLVDRVRRQSGVMRDLEDQVAARRKKPSADKTSPASCGLASTSSPCSCPGRRRSQQRHFRRSCA